MVNENEPGRATRVDHDTRWGHKNLGGPWWLALLLIPLLLAALAFAIGRGDTESGLKDRTEAALQKQGISGAKVDFDGRDATVDLAKATGAGSTDVEALVKDVDGVRVAEIEGATAAGDKMGDKSGDDAGDKSGDDAGDKSGDDADGKSGDDADDKSGDKSGDTAANCDGLQAQVDKALGENKVAFGEKAIELAGEEAAQVEKLGALLAECGASVTITGHTDDRARPNSPLSDGRASAVADALEAAGVTVVSAEGVGADDPIGDNATQAGRDLNRYADIQVQ